MTDWSDLVARVRGLSGRLLGDQTLRSLAQSRDLAACAALLATAGVIPAPLDRPSPLTLELGVRRHAARRLRVLGHWANTRLSRLAPLFEDEDRRSIRAMLRGAASGAPAESRLLGLVPTPSLPERALMELSRRGDVASVVAQLALLASPYSAALSVEAGRQHPNLLRLECALNRAFAIRATIAAARADAPLRAYVEATLDVENIWSALLAEPIREVGVVRKGAMAGRQPQIELGAAGEWFVDGGRHVSRLVFDAAIAAPTSAERHALLSATSDVPWLRAALAGGPHREAAVLRALIAQQRRLARVLPLGTAPITEYMLRLRLEVMTLQGIVWSIAMRMPRSMIERAWEMSA